MDPYLEWHWLDVQTAFVSEVRRFLNRSLPLGLAARAEERAAIESGGDRLRSVGVVVEALINWSLNSTPLSSGSSASSTKAGS